ncbi:MAG TPA: hypothetical protein VN721_16635 [Flavipsychrobacter sp.]|nr:hypothetical protein [Flavipsychrobacter sp.]
MFCPKVSSEIRAAYKSFDQYINAHIDTALQFTENLQKVLQSPTADIITALTGNIGTAIRTDLLKVLNDVIPALSIADTCKSCTTLANQLQCYTDNLKKLSPDLQDGILVKMASKIAGALHGNKLKTALYDLYTQAKYTANK